MLGTEIQSSAQTSIHNYWSTSTSPRCYLFWMLFLFPQMRENFQRLLFRGKTFGTKRRSPGSKLRLHQEVGRMLVPGPFWEHESSQSSFPFPHHLQGWNTQQSGLSRSNFMRCWNSPIDRFSIVELPKQQHKLMVQKGWDWQRASYHLMAAIHTQKRFPGKQNLPWCL